MMWYDTDLSKKQATKELRGTEEGSITAPHERSSACSWYKTLLNPWVPTNSSFMSDWAVGDQYLLLQRDAFSQLINLIFGCGTTTKGFSSLSVHYLEINGSQVTLPLGDCPPVQGSITAPAGLGALTLIEAKCNEFQLWEATCKAGLPAPKNERNGTAAVVG